MNVRLAGLGGALAIAGGLVLGPAPAAAEPRPAAAAPNLSGHWRLNKQLSDDETAKLAAVSTKADAKQAPAKPEGNSGEAAGTGRGGGRGKPVAANPSVPAVDDDPRGAARKAGNTDDITVTQSEVEITVVDRAGQTRNFYPNGKTYKADEGASTVKSLWKDGVLVFEKRNVRGWKLTDSWQLAPDGARLRCDSRFEGGGRPTVAVKRIYDRVNDAK